MASSVVAICNRALDLIGADPIASLADPSRSARLCDRNYPLIRDAVTRAYPWNCAQRRASLAALGEAPAWQYARQYQLPNDCLRLRRIEGEPSDRTEYRIEGRRVLTDAEPPLRIVYLARVDDPGEIDPLLADAIAVRLAADLAFSLTGSASLGQALFQLYRDRLAEARSADAQEGSAEDLTASDWLESRV